MKILDDSALKQILEELGSSAYFYQKEKGKWRDNEKDLYEEDGSVIATFTSELRLIEPGDEDSLGKSWHPKTKDEFGNPLRDKNGKLKKEWPKYEVMAIVKGKEKVYGLGSDFSAQFKGVVSEMQKNNIKNAELSGTKWKIVCLGQHKWDITFLGRVELPKKNGNGAKKEKDASNFEKVKSAVLKAKENQPRIGLTGIEKKDLVDAVAFMSGLDEKKVLAVWKEVLESGIVREEGSKVFYN